MYTYNISLGPGPHRGGMARLGGEGQAPGPVAGRPRGPRPARVARLGWHYLSYTTFATSFATFEETMCLTSSVRQVAPPERPLPARRRGDRLHRHRRAQEALALARAQPRPRRPCQSGKGDAAKGYLI